MVSASIRKGDTVDAVSVGDAHHLFLHASESLPRHMYDIGLTCVGDTPRFLLIGKALVTSDVVALSDSCIRDMTRGRPVRH